MELYLTQLLGLYFLIVGVIVLMRRSSIMPAIYDMGRNRSLLLIVAVIELAAGLALVLAYPEVSWSIPGIISLVGYIMVIEGIVYLAAPLRVIQKFIRMFNRKEWYMWGGIVSVVAGAYLAGTGFGFI